MNIMRKTIIHPLGFPEVKIQIMTDTGDFLGKRTDFAAFNTDI